MNVQARARERRVGEGTRAIMTMEAWGPGLTKGKDGSWTRERGGRPERVLGYDGAGLRGADEGRGRGEPLASGGEKIVTEKG